jgi:allantoate deiminase
VAYCEVHIEQGPVLEAEGLPVGVVSAIQGQSRMDVRFTGQAGHAGTVPMAMRHDALCAASDFVLAVETLAHDTDGLVATVGQLSLYPGASNVIPGEVTLSLDVRHPDDAVREDACRRLEAQAREIARARGASFRWQTLQAHTSVPCDAHLRELLARAIADQGHEVLSLASGAGHDAVIVSTLAPIAMLFVRCAGGISHNPAESVTEGDVADALDVLERFVMLLAQERNGGGAV